MRPLGKGQGSVEFLAILGVALVVIVVMTVAANDRLMAIGKERSLTDAQNSVNDLARAANNVYHRGSGSSQNVFINIPSDTNLSKSYIANHTINLNLRGTDVSARTEAQVSGAFPPASGGAWVKLLSKGSYISVGNYYLDINRTSLYFIMQNGTSATFPLTIYNRGNMSIAVNISTDVSKYQSAFLLTLEPATGFTIPALSSIDMNFTFFTYSAAGGIYPALATFIARNATSGEAISEQLQLPLTIQVTLPPQYQNLSGAARLILSPSKWNVRLPSGNGSDQLFFVTTDGTFTAETVSLTASENGNFSISGLTPPFYNVSANDPPGPGIRTLTMNFPAGGSNGNYIGTLNATADGAYRATTILNFTIDSVGPDAGNLSSSDQMPRNTTLVRISLNATEIFGGYVAACQYSINNGAYTDMAALDGTFNGYIEGAYADTTLTADGLNNITARCRDDLGNWGNTTNISIYVDSSGPIVTITGVSASVQDITVNATASELLTGNLNVSWCNVTFFSNDTGISNTTQMTPSSGSYNASYETLNATMNLDYGLYTISVTCADSHDNTRTASYEFYHNINSCGVLLNHDNLVYRLANNVNTSSAYCFQVTADNVTLNCMGKSMTGSNASGSYGFYTDQTGTTIKDCIISNFSSAIYYNAASGGAILNNSASTTYNGGYGVVLSTTTGTAISNNTASSANGSAIYLASASNGNTLNGDIATGATGSAITLSGSSSNNIANTNATSTSNYGIYLSSSTGNTITNSNAYSASTHAVYIASSSDGNAIGIAGTTNDSAIYIDGGQNNSIDCQGASIIGTNTTGNYGIYSNQQYTAVSNCNISNFATAIYFQDVANGSISNTLASSTYGSGGYGIYLNNSDNNLVTGSTVGTFGSGTTGILLSSASSSNNISGSSISSANGIALSLMISSAYNTVSFCNITGKTGSTYSGAVHMNSSARNNFTNVNITSTSGTAFYANGSTSTYIRISNSTLSQASTGYVLYFVSGNFSLDDSNINKSGTGTYAISSASASSLTDNVINGSSSSSYSVYMAGTGNIVVANTIFSKTSTGAYFTSGSNKIIGNNISANSTGDFGIYLASTSTSNTIENNTLSSTAASALYITSASSTNTIRTNSFASIANNSVTVAGASNSNKFIRNNMTSTSGAGIYITNASGTNLTGNNLNSSSGCGAWLNTLYSSYTIFYGNSISSSSNNSICLSSSNSNNFTNNTLYSTSANGIALSNSNSSTFANNSINASASGILLDANSIGNSFHHNLLYRASAYVNNSNSANFFSIANFTNTSGLAGYWSFDANISSTSAGAVPDESGNAGTGTLGGGTASQAPVWAQSGKIGGAYVFDGSNDYVSYSNAPNLTTSGTLSAWVNVYSWPTSFSSVIFKGPGDGWASIDYGLFRDSTNTRFLGTLNDGTNSMAGNGPRSSNISTGTWYHVAFTWNGSVSKFYTNGAESDSYNWAYGAGTRSGNMKVGIAVGGANYPFNGSIDDVRIYSRALSPSEISALYNLKAQGNYYDNIQSVAIYDSDGDGYGDSGAAYPYTSATSSRWLGSGTDYGPMYANTTSPYACMVLDIAGQTYNVAANIVGASGACFSVTAQNVTLNCNGHTLIGDNSAGSYGVYTNQFNTTVKNCNISSFSTGLFYDTADNGTIQNVTAFTSHSGSYLNTEGRGIYLYNGANFNTIIDSSGTSTSYVGIYVYTSSNNNQIINSNGTSTSQQGIYLDTGSSNNQIINSAGTSTSSYGIRLFSNANNNQIINSTAYSASTHAIQITSSSSNNILNLTKSFTTGQSAVYIDGGTNNLIDCQGASIRGNNATDTYGIYSSQFNTTIKNCNISNFATGIYFQGATNGTIQNTTAFTTASTTYSGGHGININANSNLLINNTAFSNFGYGIYVLYGINNTLIGNNASSATADGIYLYSPTSNNLLINNTGIALASGNGIGAGSNNILINNTAISYSGNGIFSALNCLLIGNNATSTNGGHGIWLYIGSNNNTLINNTGTSLVSGDGIYLYASINNTLINNTGTAAAGAGIELLSSNYTTIANSRGISNSGAGISVSPYLYGTPTGNQIFNSTFISSTSYGVYLSSATNNYFENNSNCISCSNAIARFYSNAAQNISSNTNTGWWPLLSSSGSDATTLANTAYYNGSAGGRTSAWVADSSLTYWYGGQANLYGCQNLTSPGVYLLKQNVSINGATCFTISAANVTIDCQNNWITGDSTVGTSGVFSAQTSSTVQNCNIQYFDDGVYFNNTQLGLVQNSFANVSTSYSYAVPYIQGSAFAFWSTTSRTNTIQNSVGIGKTGNGLALRSYNVSVINFTGTSTAGSTAQSGGIWIIGGTGNRITNSVGICTGGSCNGISMRGTTSQFVANSTGTSSATYGVYISQTSDVIIDNVTMNTTSTGGGIQLGDRCYRNLIKNSPINATTASAYGIYESTSGSDTALSRNNTYINVSISGVNKGIFLYDGCDAGAYFENVSNNIAGDNSVARFRSNATLNISSKTNIGWWPLIFSNGSDALALANTAFYNGSSGGKNSDWSANPALSYWYGGQADVRACMVLSAPGTYTLASAGAYSPALGSDLLAGYDFTTWTKDAQTLSTTTNSFTTNATNSGVYKPVITGLANGNTYKIHIAGTNNATTNPALNILGNSGTLWLGTSGASFNATGTFTNTEPSNPSLIELRAYASAGTVTITEFTLQQVPASNCINVSAANVTLDCNGASLVGYNLSGTYGVYSTQSNTTVKNCNISNFQHGIYFNGATYGTIMNDTVTTTYNGGNGIYFSSSSSLNQIINSSANSANGTAIYLYQSNNNQIINSTATELLTANPPATYGIHLSSASNNQIINSIANGNAWGSIVIDSGSNNNTIANTTSTTTGNYALLMGGATNNYIINSTFLSSGYICAYIYSGSNNNQIINSKITTTAGITAFHLESSNNSVINSNISATSSYGIEMIGATNSQFINSTFYSSGNHAIYMYSSSNNNVFNLTQGITTKYSAVYIESGANNYIDCQGANITGSNGSSTYGVYSAQSNTTVKNCIVSNFSDAIRFEGAASGLIQNTTASTTYTTGYGIYLLNGADGNTLLNDSVTAKATAIYINGSSSNIVAGTYANNTASGSNPAGFSHAGAYVFNSNSNQIINSTISGVGYGIIIHQGAGKVINSTGIASSAGIFIAYTGSAQVLNSTGISTSSGAGIQLSGTSETANNVINASIGISASGSGISLSAGGANNYIDCQGRSMVGANTSSTYGIYSVLARTTIKNCIISNFSDGIRFNGASNGSIQNTIASTTFTSGSGIYLTGGATNNTITNSIGISAFGKGINVDAGSNNNIFTSSSGASTSSNGIQLSLSNNTAITGFNDMNNSAGLVSYWKLDEGSGTVANDNRGGNNGNLTNSPVWMTGKSGQALGFNGSYVLVGSPAPASLTFTDSQPWTFSHWVNFISDSVYAGKHAYGEYFGIGSTYLHFRDKNYAYWYWYAAIPPNTWHHVVYVADGAGSLTAYLDGVSQGRQPIPTQLHFEQFGRAYAEDRLGLNGSLDELMIFNRALSAQEVQLLYNNPSSRIPTASSTSSVGIYLNASANNYFENSTNCPSCSNAAARFYSNSSQNTSSHFNTGWWPLLDADGSNATVLANTAFFNGSSGGFNSDWSANAQNTYWKGGNYTPLQLCGVLSSPNTIYRLNSDVSINGATCFTVTAQNVTLNCDGHSVSGNNASPTYGVYSNQLNTTIKNCNIQNFSTGILFTGGSGTIQNTIANTTQTISDYYGARLGIGIFVVGSTAIINSSGISANGYGISAYSPGSNTFTNSTAISTNSRAAYVESSNNNIFTNFAAIGGANEGFFFNDADNNQIINSNGTSASSVGIFIYGGSDNNQITNSTAYSATSKAIQITSTSNNNVLNLTRSFTTNQSAVYIDGGANNSIDCQGASLIGSNGASAYGVFSSQFNTTVKNCNISSFSTGIYFNGATNGTINNATISTVYATDGQYNGNGILFVSSTTNYNQISNSNITAVGYGIHFWSSCKNNSVTNTTATTTYAGGTNAFLAEGSVTGTIISNSAFIANGGAAISFVSSSSNNILTNNNATSSQGVGIYLSQITNSILTGNNITSAISDGVQLTSSSNSNNLTGNYIYSNPASATNALLISGSNGNIVANNSISGSTNGDTTHGVVHLSGSDYNLVSGNNVTGADYAFLVNAGSDYNNMTNNYMSGARNTFGCYRSNSAATYNTFLNNSCTLSYATSGWGVAFPVSSATNNYILNNTFNLGGNIGYLDTAGNLYNTVSGNQFLGSGGSTGIEIDSNGNNLTNNNITSASGYGIYLYSASSNILTSNNVYSNSVSGLYLSASSFNNLTNNNASSNQSFGLYIYSSSSNNTLTNNTISSTSYGGLRITLTSAGNMLYNNTISTAGTSYSDVRPALSIASDSNGTTLIGNSISATAEHALWIGSFSNIIANNTITSTAISAINLTAGASLNNFTLNTISSSSSLGIGISNSSFNYFANNTNSLAYPTTAFQRFYSDSSQNSSSANNTGWWPLLASTGSDATALASTAYFNGSAGGLDSAGALAPANTYWMGSSSTPISQCAVLSSANTIYALGSAVSINGSNCFNVTAQNVTLNCNGYSVTGNNAINTYGVYTDQFNTTVKNCVISTFMRQIYTLSAQSAMIQNNTLTSTYATEGDDPAGIYFSSSTNCTAINNTASSRERNAIMLSGTGSTITNNTIYLNRTGALSDWGSALRIQGANTVAENNTIYAYGNGNGVLIKGVSASTSGVSLKGNAISVASGYGVWVTNHTTAGSIAHNDTIDCQGANIIGNNASAIYGIYSTQFNTTIKNCNISNFNVGIGFLGAANGSIINNNASTTASTGIYLSGSSNNIIVNSTGTSTLNQGIYLYSSSNNNTIINSMGISSSLYGITIGTNSNGNQILNSTAYSATSHAIYITSGSNSNILNLTAGFTTNRSAVYIDGGANNSIDCQGASISGNNLSGTYGIFSSQYNTTIQNCSISNFERGVYFSSSNQSDVLNSIISTSSNVGYGIYVTGGTVYLIAGNNVSSTGTNASSTATTSIYLTAATGSLIENNTVNASYTILPALFNYPYDVAESGNNLYVADASNYLVRQIDLTTNFSSTVAGELSNPSYAEGVGADAHFYNTYSVAMGESGYLYVADYSNHVIRKINLATNETSLVAGSAGASGYTNGVGSAAKFTNPRGLAYDPAGYLYVADEGNQRIRKIDLATNTVSLLAGSGTADYIEGTGSAARFYNPGGLSLGTDGYLYVADTYNHRIRRINLATNATSLVAGSGSAAYLEGVGAAAKFYYPNGVAFGADGYLYVADTYDHCIRKIELATNTTSLVVGSTARASGFTDGVGSAARLYYPRGITYDAAGILYIADSSNNRIRVVNLSAASISRITGSGTAGYTDGAGTTTYSGHGIYLASTATSNIVRNNAAFSSSANGVDVEASSTNLTNNSGTSLTSYGIYAGIPQYGLVANNTGVSYAGSGLYFYSTTTNGNARIYNNSGNSTTDLGIIITARDSNISGNIGISFNDIGFETSSCTRNDFTSNIGISNVSYGNYYASATYNRVSNDSGASLYNLGGRFGSSTYNNITTGDYFSNSSQALYLDSSTNNNFSNNTIASNYSIGLYIVGGSNNNSFLNNFATSRSSHALRVESSYFNTLTNNTGMSNTSFGISLYYAENNTFIDNTAFSNASYGMYLYSSTTAFTRYNTLIENNATSGSGSAIYIDARSNNNTLINNTAYSGASSGISISSAHNNTLNGNIATSNSSSYGIYLTSSNENKLMNNNATSRSVQAILLSNSNNNNLTNNVATILVSNSAYILHLVHSNNNTVSNNVFSSTLLNTGIRLENASDNNLTNNVAGAGASYGIYLYNGTGAGVRAERNTLTNNTASSTSSYGIYLSGASGNVLIGNNATSGTSSAVNISKGANNSLINNTMYSGSSYGIYILNSLNNYFEYNNNSLEYTGSTIQKFYAGAAQNTSSKGNKGWWPVLAGTGTESVIQSATAYFNGTLGGLDANGVPNPANTYWYNGQS